MTDTYHPLILENQALIHLNKYIQTGKFGLDANIQKLEYTDYDVSALSCPDVIDACKGIYGFHMSSSHIYLSAFVGPQLIRFKYKYQTNKFSPLDYVSLPYKGPLILLLDISSIDDLLPIQLNTYNNYPIYLQYCDIKNNLENSEIANETEILRTYRLISKQRYGISTRLKIARNIEDLSDFRELSALFKGIFITTEYIAVRAIIAQTVCIISLEWEN